MPVCDQTWMVDVPWGAEGHLKVKGHVRLWVRHILTIALFYFVFVTAINYLDTPLVSEVHYWFITFRVGRFKLT